MKRGELMSCQMCGAQITRNSVRQLYCQPCKRRKNVEWSKNFKLRGRQRRWTISHHGYELHGEIGIAAAMIARSAGDAEAGNMEAMEWLSTTGIQWLRIIAPGIDTTFLGGSR